MAGAQGTSAEQISKQRFLAMRTTLQQLEAYCKPPHVLQLSNYEVGDIQYFKRILNNFIHPNSTTTDKHPPLASNKTKRIYTELQRRILEQQNAEKRNSEYKSIIKADTNPHIRQLMTLLTAKYDPYRFQKIDDLIAPDGSLAIAYKNNHEFKVFFNTCINKPEPGEPISRPIYRPNYAKLTQILSNPELMARYSPIREEREQYAKKRILPKLDKQLTKLRQANSPLDLPTEKREVLVAKIHALENTRHLVLTRFIPFGGAIDTTLDDNSLDDNSKKLRGPIGKLISFICRLCKAYKPKSASTSTIETAKKQTASFKQAIPWFTLAYKSPPRKNRLQTQKDPDTMAPD
jgi:hypothetical protein